MRLCISAHDLDRCPRPLRFPGELEIAVPQGEKEVEGDGEPAERTDDSGKLALQGHEEPDREAADEAQENRPPRRRMPRCSITV